MLDYICDDPEGTLPPLYHQLLLSVHDLTL
jgi:hypothetical protein